MKAVWLLIFLIVVSGGNNKSAINPPSGLMVEFIREPEYVPISDPRPEFSWILHENESIQTAYHLLVASSEELLEKDTGDLWNSSRTFSSKSSEVEYSGHRLSDYSKYYWKVRIWDWKGKSSSWSEIQSFRTGVLKDYGTAGNRFVETHIKPEKSLKRAKKVTSSISGKMRLENLNWKLIPHQSYKR